MDGLDVGELVDVIDHNRQAIGAELLGDGGQTGDGGGEEREGKKNVDMAVFGLVLFEEEGDVLGFEDGGDD